MKHLLWLPTFIVVGLCCYALVVAKQPKPTPGKTFVAICSGQKYQFQGEAFRTAEGGCVTVFGKEQPVSWICGCTLVTEVPSEAKK